MIPVESSQGNCNSSTSTILYKAGVSKEKLKEIKDIIPGLDYGIGNIKPWTKEEQIDAINQAQHEQMERYESLEKSFP